MIYLIITTCIVDKYGIQNNEHRKNRYIECIQWLLKLLEDIADVKPIIVENNGSRTTYLNQLECDVVYTDNNNYKYKNKGVNELLDIKHIINIYNINDDDFVVKLTGRYKLLDLEFINLIKNNITEYDSFVKFFNVCTLKYLDNDCVLGMFGIKCKYLKSFEYKCIKSPECEFAEFVRSNINNVMEVKNLNLECCFAGDLRTLIV
jgi:hypothetical protein